MSIQQGTCPVCDQEQQVTKAGLVYKHADGDTQCAGSGQPPRDASEDDGDDWLDEGESAEGDPGPESPDEPEVDDPDTSPAALASKADTFTWQMVVNAPALYLDDPAWHGENGLMAVRAAEAAGCKVAGEARWDCQPGYGTPGKVLLTYAVPVKS